MPNNTCFIFIAGHEDIFWANNTGDRIIPADVADGFRTAAFGSSSHETFQTFATPTEQCNINLPRNDRQSHSQGLIGFKTKL